MQLEIVKTQRLRELDFLRGVAILLVLLRHTNLFSFTSKIGWIGVDLFFVLSGFLVSGLLFKEYIKFGNIQPKLFLIRRGFKIYPIYYIFYLPYLMMLFENKNFKFKGILSDLTFTQNYRSGWGFAYPASWSLSVEEHFYYGFAFLLWLGLKYNKIILKSEDFDIPFKKRFGIKIIAILFLVFLLRFISNLIFPLQEARNFTMTHLRIDSLLFGTLIAYFYYFRINHFKKMFLSMQYFLSVICILGLIWTPFIEPLSSFFVKTIGFTLLYISFGILLVFFLLKDTINELLNIFFTKRIVDLISKIGYCSYSIYIIHSFVIMYLNFVIDKRNLIINHYLFFILVSAISIFLGVIMTFRIENIFLKIRDKHFPGRV